MNTHAERIAACRQHLATARAEIQNAVSIIVSNWNDTDGERQAWTLRDVLAQLWFIEVELATFQPQRLYSISADQRKLLEPLASCQREHAAIVRLKEGRGDAADVRVVAQLHQWIGEDENAADLLRMLAGDPDEPAVRRHLGAEVQA